MNKMKTCVYLVAGYMIFLAGSIMGILSRAGVLPNCGEDCGKLVILGTVVVGVGTLFPKDVE